MAPENTTTDQVEEEQGGTSVTPGSKGNPIDALLELARKQIKYTEKDSEAYIDEHETNAGSGNYTKYARDLSGNNTTMVGSQTFNDYYGIDANGIYYGNKQTVAWCAMFVDWCFVMVFGYDAMKNMTFHEKDGALVSSCRDHYKANGRFFSSGPQPGDEIFFDGHTGLVSEVDDQYVYTIEGNTSGNAEVVSEGGCVCNKKYSLGSSSIIGYGRPDWSQAPETFLRVTTGGTFGTEYVNAYITSCTRTKLSIAVSASTVVNSDAIVCTFYKGTVNTEDISDLTPDSDGNIYLEGDKVPVDKLRVEQTKVEYDPNPKIIHKRSYKEGKLVKIDIDISDLPPNELVTLELSASAGSISNKISLGFTTPQEYPKQVQNVKIEALRYSYDTVFDTDYTVYFSRLPWGKPSDWGYWKDEKSWDTGYTVYLIKNREIYKELFNFTYKESRSGIPINLPSDLLYTRENLYFDLNKVLLNHGITNLRELGMGSNIQIGVRTWIRGKYTDGAEEVQLSLPELPKGSNTLQLDYKTNVTNRCYFNINRKYARLSIYKK